MSSILKVDTIQTTAGAAPTTKDLGFAAGSIIQVKHTVNTTSNLVNTTSDFPVASGFKLSITPKFNTSKILVIMEIDAWLQFGSGNNKIGKYAIRLNSQSNATVADKRIGINFAGGTGSNQDHGQQVTMVYYDSPNSTNAQEYEAVCGRWGSSYPTNVMINGGGYGHSSITLMEIAQ